jgi:predicted LPLAT superfamily acyltransferase
VNTPTDSTLAAGPATHAPPPPAPQAGPAPSPAAAPRTGADATPAWAAHAERSNRTMLRCMAWIATTLGRPMARLVLHGIATYYLLFAPASVRRASVDYLTRALGRRPTWRDRYRHLHHFSSTVLDRIYFVRGQMGRFDLELHDDRLVDAALAEGRGVVLLGAHIGSFEVLHAIGESRHGLRVAMAMYPHNAQMIHEVLQALAPDFPLGIIPIGQPGSALAIRDWLDAGGLVGMLGDRLPPPGGSRDQLHALPLLGRPALFSDGPLRVAQLLRRQVLFMVGLYHGGRRYELRWVPLADFRTPPADPAAREAQLQDALRAYVAHLDALCRRAPYNWFNFFDVWQDDGRGATA